MRFCAVLILIVCSSLSVWGQTVADSSITIVKQLEAGKNVLVSAHSNTLRSIIMNLEQMDEAQVVGLEVDTANLIVYDYSGGEYIREELPEKGPAL